MRKLSDRAARVLTWLQQAGSGASTRAVTVRELADLLALERPLLDAALGELDEAGLIRLRGAMQTSESYLELTDAGRRRADPPRTAAA